MLQSQARELYMQTDLTKTQIAEMLGIPRRTLHYWIRQNNWDRLRRCASHMPSLIAERCYHIMSLFTDQLLSEGRLMRPITYREADTLHKLVLTINKLKNRSTLNESMEMFGVFMDNVNRKSPEMADKIMPFVDEYIASRANMSVGQLRPSDLDEQGVIPLAKEADTDNTEQRLDAQDLMEWNSADEPPYYDDPKFRDMGAGSAPAAAPVPDTPVAPEPPVAGTGHPVAPEVAATDDATSTSDVFLADDKEAEERAALVRELMSLPREEMLKRVDEMVASVMPYRYKHLASLPPDINPSRPGC